MSIDYRVLLLAGLTILLWGFWGFFGKVALEKNMAPRSVFLAEVFTSAVCAVAVVLIFSYRKLPVAAHTSSWNVYGVASGVGLALGLLCYYFALERAPASILVPLTATYPAVSVLLSYAFLHERPYASQWLGIVLVIIGTILLLSGPTAVLPHGGSPRQ
jgi:bacterial/archaeal transporter family protein